MGEEVVIQLSGDKELIMDKKESRRLIGKHNIPNSSIIQFVMKFTRGFTRILEAKNVLLPK